MKKLLLINDYKINGGAETVVKLQAECLKKNYQVDFFYGEEQLSKRSAFNYIYAREIEKKLFTKVSEGGYDIIHIHNYYHLLSPSIFKAIRRLKSMKKEIKVFYTAHDYHLVCPNSGYFFYKDGKIKNFTTVPAFQDIVFKKIDKRSLSYNILKKLQWLTAYNIFKFQNDIDVIITPSEFLKKVLISKLRQPIEVIRNPLLITEKKQINPLLTKTEKDRLLRMVFFGRLSVEKGLFEFIELLSQVQEIPFVFSIYGEGPQKEELELLIGEKGMKQKVILKGAKSHESLMNELTDYNVFVLPSIWYENAPMSIIEAANAGLILLTSGHGGMVEIVEECGGGFFFEPGNIKSLEHSLAKCREKLNNCGESLMPDEQLYQKFSLQQFNSSLIKAYEKYA